MMAGPSFDDTENYWVDNPDERSIICVSCGFDSDDIVEATNHLRSHETPVDDWVHAADIWSELAA